VDGPAPGDSAGIGVVQHLHDGDAHGTAEPWSCTPSVMGLRASPARGGPAFTVGEEAVPGTLARLLLLQVPPAFQSGQSVAVRGT
jgi:hypothetical protein